MLVKETIAVAVLLCLKSTQTLDNPGHLKPLSHQGPEVSGYKSTGIFPPAEEFFRNYIKTRTPLLLKGVLNGVESRYTAYEKWSDEYLTRQYGRQVVEVERGKKENRVDGVRHMTLADFIRVYRENDLYMVHNVPEPMEGDVLVPKSLLCGGLEASITEAVIWFCSGGTKSLLHNDMVDNINCLLDGHKDVLLFNTSLSSAIMSHGFVAESGYSKVDVDRVDLLQFPQFDGLPWQRISLDKGDCLYIPYQMFHQVNTAPGRSIAVNIWFSHIWWFNQSDCSADPPDHVPLSEIIYASANEQYRTVFLEPFAALDNVTLNEFDIGLTPTETTKIFSEIDENQDGNLTWSELYNFDIDWLLQHHPQVSDDQKYRHKTDEL